MTVFFITRPEIVVGPNLTIEGEDLPLHHQKDISDRSTRKLGHLPERNYDDDLPAGEVRWGAGQTEYNPSMLPDHKIQTSPLGYNITPLPRGNSPNTNYLSDPRRSPRESSSLIDEDDYGRLPG